MIGTVAEKFCHSFFAEIEKYKTSQKFSIIFTDEFEREKHMSEIGRSRYRATIAGHDYTIIGTETKKHMDMVTKVVDEQFSDLKKASPRLTSEQVAILTAINAVSDQLKKQERLLALEKEVEELRAVAEKAAKLEKTVKKIEEVEEKAKKTVEKNGGDTSQVINHLQAREILNEEVRERIQEKNKQTSLFEEKSDADETAEEDSSEKSELAQEKARKKKVQKKKHK
jgi:cell division protein ZapA